MLNWQYIIPHRPFFSIFLLSTFLSQPQNSIFFEIDFRYNFFPHKWVMGERKICWETGRSARKKKTLSVVNYFEIEEKEKSRGSKLILIISNKLSGAFEPWCLLGGDGQWKERDVGQLFRLECQKLNFLSLPIQLVD